MKSTRMAAIAAVTVTLVAVCGSSISSAARGKSITISVASLIPGSTPAAIQQFNDQVAEFEKANPNINVKPVEYQWTGPTFAAKLAATGARVIAHSTMPYAARLHAPPTRPRSALLAR